MTPRGPTLLISNKKSTTQPLLTLTEQGGEEKIQEGYIPQSDSSTLCGVLTEVQNGGNLCHVKSCTPTKYPNTVTGSLLPHCAYLMLPGSHILYPISLFYYKDFKDDNISKLQQISIILDEAGNIRVIFNTTPHKQLSNEV